MHDEHKQALIDADRRRLVRAATRLLGPAEAEDVVQDAYVRALEADIGTLNAAQAWLLTVVRNLAVDRLRRREWLQRWVAEVGDAVPVSPSAERVAAEAEDATHALRLIAAHLTPAEGAAVLLCEVFEVAHADIAAASGKSEANSRQGLRRALSRLRQAGEAPRSGTEPELDADEDSFFRLCLQSLQHRDPQALWAMLRQPPIRAMAVVMGTDAPKPQGTTSSVVVMGGQLGLVLSLDGVRLCVIPLGVRTPFEAVSP